MYTKGKNTCLRMGEGGVGVQLGMGFPAQNVPVDAKSISLTHSDTIFVVEMKEKGWRVINVCLSDIVTVCLHSVVVWGIYLKLKGRKSRH